MLNSQIISRRVNAAVDFKPDMAPSSPSAQARRLSSLLSSDKPHILNEDAITDCPDALDEFREYQYRKIFTGTSHSDFLALDETDPEHIDWQIRIHEIASEHAPSRRK